MSRKQITENQRRAARFTEDARRLALWPKLVALLERLVANGFPAYKAERDRMVKIIEEASALLAEAKKGEKP